MIKQKNASRKREPKRKTGKRRDKKPGNTNGSEGVCCSECALHLCGEHRMRVCGFVFARNAAKYACCVSYWPSFCCCPVFFIPCFFFSRLQIGHRLRYFSVCLLLPKLPHFGIDNGGIGDFFIELARNVAVDGCILVGSQVAGFPVWFQCRSNDTADVFLHLERQRVTRRRRIQRP